MKKPNNPSKIEPFNNCPALDGYHCQTNSLAKIFYHNNHPLSEDMLLGLGAGMGFIYWKMKMGDSDYVFIGGRGNNKEFFNDIGKRTGVQIESKSTSSIKKAQAALLEKMAIKEPVMCFGDMCFLPWFELPEDYHFGGHTFVICGYDGYETLLGSDMDQKAIGLKKGFYHEISLEQLSEVRNSPYKPFPPKNTYLELDFENYHDPTKEDIYSAIRQTVESQLHPPIKNVGIKGIRHSAKELLKWPDLFDDYELRMNLFSIYIFIEVGGTGGGCFRYMYSRFLKEAAEITGNKEIDAIAEDIYKSGKLFTEIGMLFKNAETDTDIKERISIASDKFKMIAEIEEEAFNGLDRIVL